MEHSHHKCSENLESTQHDFNRLADEKVDHKTEGVMGVGGMAAAPGMVGLINPNAGG